jgi:hypothetical protein
MPTFSGMCKSWHIISQHQHITEQMFIPQNFSNSSSFEDCNVTFQYNTTFIINLRAEKITAISPNNLTLWHQGI